MKSWCSSSKVDTAMVPLALGRVDPSTKVSREVTDEEVLQYARAKNDDQDPEGKYVLRKLRTNQLMSKLTRDAYRLAD
eukprot:s5665_g8.t1